MDSIRLNIVCRHVPLTTMHLQLLSDVSSALMVVITAQMLHIVSVVMLATSTVIISVLSNAVQPFLSITMAHALRSVLTAHTWCLIRLHVITVLPHVRLAQGQPQAVWNVLVLSFTTANVSANAQQTIIQMPIFCVSPVLPQLHSAMCSHSPILWRPTTKIMNCLLFWPSVAKWWWILVRSRVLSISLLRGYPLVIIAGVLWGSIVLRLGSILIRLCQLMRRL